MTTHASLKQIIALGFALFLLVSYQFVGADWTAPLSSPPTCSAGDPGCDPPINVGTTDQTKFADITAVDLNAADYVKAGLQMWSPEYCDENGLNCSTPPFSGSSATLPSGCADGQVAKFSGGTWSCADDVGAGSLTCTTNSQIVSACLYPSGNMSNAVGCPAGTVPAGPAYSTGSCSTNNETFSRTCISITCS